MLGQDEIMSALIEAGYFVRLADGTLKQTSKASPGARFIVDVKEGRIVSVEVADDWEIEAEARKL